MGNSDSWHWQIESERPHPSSDFPVLDAFVHFPRILVSVLQWNC
jgi:hypothetical protein